MHNYKSHETLSNFFQIPTTSSCQVTLWPRQLSAKRRFSLCPTSSDPSKILKSLSTHRLVTQCRHKYRRFQRELLRQNFVPELPGNIRSESFYILIGAGNSLYIGRLWYRMCSCQSTVGLITLPLYKICFHCTKSLFYSWLTTAHMVP